MPAEVRHTKGERTRERIRSAALRSFRENGYDATTIRGLADELGMSVGATNYHFASKNHLIQELYLDVQERHWAAAQPLLAGATELIEPYHAHAGEFLSAAVSPRSPINPLSAESAEAFAIVEGLFAEAIDGAAPTRLTDAVRERMPDALVLAHLLLALFWVYDTSEGRQRTRLLLDRSLRLLSAVLPLARLPLVRGAVAEVLALVGSVRA